MKETKFMEKKQREEEIITLNKYKELIEYIKDNVIVIKKINKNKANARKIGLCTDTLDVAYYVIEDFIINGLRGAEHKAFITLYALAQAIDISIQATIKLYEIIVGVTCIRNEIVSPELQEFIDEVLNNVKMVDEYDTNILLNSIDCSSYEISITSLKNDNFENREVSYRKLILDYLNHQKELKFVKHIIFRIIMNDKIKEFEKEFDNE